MALQAAHRAHRRDPAAIGSPVVPVVVALTCAALVAAVALLLDARSAAPPAGPERGPDGPAGAARATAEPAVVAREVLRDWDDARAGAWRAADAGALARLYVPGSVAGTRDVRLLRRWTARSLRVTRLQPQVLAVAVARASSRRLVLRVTDRLLLEATWQGRTVGLPRDALSTRRIVLVRSAATTAAWQVAAVTGLATPGSLGG